MLGVNLPRLAMKMRKCFSSVKRPPLLDELHFIN